MIELLHEASGGSELAWVFGSGFPKSHDFAGVKDVATGERVTRPEFIGHPQSEGWEPV